VSDAPGAVAELERRLSMDSTDSGTPSSQERIGAKEARRAGVRAGAPEGPQEGSQPPTREKD
jgi:hypothetical protein